MSRTSLFRILVGFTVLAFARADASVLEVIQQNYLKASNTRNYQGFGHAVAVSGNTIAIGAYQEASSATGVNGNENDHSAPGSGAVYIFSRAGTNWVQQAYLKASNAGVGDLFGKAVALSGDILVVGAVEEASNGVGINSTQDNNDAPSSGAAYVFVRAGTNWVQKAYLKASNAEEYDRFGSSVAVSGETVVVGAPEEDHGFAEMGATYVFVRQQTNWVEQAYIKVRNNNGNSQFGNAVSISGDTLVVGAHQDADYSGAAYVFVRNGTNWTQQAHLRASNAEGRIFENSYGDQFGFSVSISGDTIAVGAHLEASSSQGVNGEQNDNSASQSGAVYIYERNGTNWIQEAYLKASNAGLGDSFGTAVSVSGDIVAVGAFKEASNTVGINGTGTNNDAFASGAAYVFARVGTNWNEVAYIKSSNAESWDLFGRAVALSDDLLIAGADQEASAATGINGDPTDNTARGSGAAYVFSQREVVEALQIVRLADNRFQIRGRARPGVSYEWQRALNIAGPWVTASVSTPSPSGEIELMGTNIPTEQAYYRLMRQ